jgi:enediyne polyketide synthase
VRVAALVRAPGVVDVVLRCDQTAFLVDHFRATCRVGAAPLPSDAPPLLPLDCEASPLSMLDPQRDLYGALLFHGERFRRIARYMRLHATECIAELHPSGGLPWFARYLPGQLVLGDPSVRDAALHAIQACIPHVLLIPSGVDAVHPAGAGEPRFLLARERGHTDRSFIYDVEIRTAEGGLLERWEGLHLQVMESSVLPEEWPPSLLVPYAERRIGELLQHTAHQVSLELEHGPDRHARGDRALQRLLGGSGPPPRRVDGKPMLEGRGVSVAHTAALTLVVASPGEVGCDLQAIESRPPQIWRELLGPDRAALAERVSRECGEESDAAATRVWTAIECMKKTGLPQDTPLVLDGAGRDGWTIFSAGGRKVATRRTRGRGEPGPLVLAALPEVADARV